MKFLTGCLVLVMLAGATGADAWPWSRKPKRLPTPIDSPVVRPKNKQLGRAKTSEHRAEHDRFGWGQEKHLMALKNPREGNHSIWQD
jgi:sex peptide (SP) family protein